MDGSKVFELLVSTCGGGGGLWLAQTLYDSWKTRKLAKSSEIAAQNTADTQKQQIQISDAQVIRNELRQDLGMVRGDIIQLRGELNSERERYSKLWDQHNLLKARYVLLEVEMERIRRYLKDRSIELPLPALEALEKLMSAAPRPATEGELVIDVATPPPVQAVNLGHEPVS